ncbi:CsiV family protein [Pseudoalteromonas tunicata]|uniref:CsiV family protein n=1 Tax=Pseudoalteromonas tunicata TaxID=314281 RepID=UPI00273FEF9E|nr:CsiV family protein [Pseudoalteromonas tunicata]MDP5211665.1 CsiV family protein [Pseudoalteromonas tunicata]
MKLRFLHLCFIGCLVQSGQLMAQRWFEAEIILFEQKADSELKEDFSFTLNTIDVSKAQSLQIDQLQQNGLENCLSQQNKVLKQNEFLSQQQVIQSVDCDPNTDYLSQLERVPLNIPALEQDHQDFNYLLAPSQLQFNDVITRLRNQGLKPLLHTGWRFSEAPEKRAPTYRLIAGKNFSANYDYLGFLRAGAVSSLGGERAIVQDNRSDLAPFLISNSALQNNDDKKEQSTWQLDGTIKLYVQHYLFIDAEFNFRDEDGQLLQLNNALFQQFRRVYSGDVHYLDHPKFGMIIQIRRFKQ